MDRPWSDEDKALLTLHYASAPSIAWVAELLGRSESALKKRACYMGLHRPSLAQPAIDRLLAALSDGRATSRELAARMGFNHRSVDALLKRSKEKGICHIAGYRRTGRAGRLTALWVAGPGKHAPKPLGRRGRAQVARVVKAESRGDKVPKGVPFKPFRDPFTAAFFGAAP